MWTNDKISAAVLAGAIPLMVSLYSGKAFPVNHWYQSLVKPFYMPPGWLFGLAWCILYPLLGVSLVAACYNTDMPWTYILPIMNIVVSVAFSGMMFALQSPFMGFLTTLLSMGLGIAVLVQYIEVNKSTLAWSLMIPYVVWTTFATLLAASVFFANLGPQERLARRNTKYYKARKSRRINTRAR